MTQINEKQQIAYDLSLIKNWQHQLNYSDKQVQDVTGVTADQAAAFSAGSLDVDTYDLAAEKMRKVAFKHLMPDLDTRSAYLLNGIKFEIRDLQLTPQQVQQITGVTPDGYAAFMAGHADGLVYEDAFDRMGVYYYFKKR